MEIKGESEILGTDYKIIDEAMTIGRIYFLHLCEQSMNPKENEFKQKVKKLASELKDSWF